MEFYINGAATEAATAGRNFGDILGELDERLEAAGSVMMAIELDGRNVDPDELPTLALKGAEEAGRVDIRAESSASMRAGAMRTLLEFLSALSEAQGEDIAELRDAFERYRSAFGGLFSVEEESFLAALSDDLANGAQALAASIPKLRSFFGERLAEIEDPVGGMRSAAKLFDSLKDDLKEVPVRMQTGKDADAIRTMMVAVEVINKAVRLLPGFSLAVPGSSSMRIGEQSWGEFFSSFNDMLRELAGAFENKDGVLIGDLAEYEILPRLEALFMATAEATEAR